MAGISHVSLRSAEEPVRQAELPNEKNMDVIASPPEADVAISQATRDEYVDAKPAKFFIPGPLGALTLFAFGLAPYGDPYKTGRKLEEKALDLVAEGRIDDALVKMTEAENTYKAAGDRSLATRAIMHEKFGDALAKKSILPEAKSQYEAAIGINKTLKRYTKIADLYGKLGDLTSKLKYYDEAIGFYRSAVENATTSRYTRQVHEYLRKIIRTQLTAGYLLEAADTADELVRRSSRSEDNRDAALEERQKVVKLILKTYLGRRTVDAQFADQAWEVFSVLRHLSGFKGLSRQDQWGIVKEIVRDFSKSKELSLSDFAFDKFGAYISRAAEGVEARAADLERGKKGSEKDGRGRAEDAERGRDRTGERPVK